MVQFSGSITKKYNISDNGLRKICIKNNVPLPRAGYWSKVKFNKKVTKVPLPNLNDKSTDIELYIRVGKEDDSIHPHTFRAKIRKEIDKDTKLNFIVPERLSNPDVLIRKAKIDLKNKKPRAWGNTQGLLIPSYGILNIAVSKKSLPRALNIMGRLIKPLKKRGHIIEVGETTKVIIDGEPLKFRLKEMVKRVMVPDGRWQRTELVPSGVLSIRAEAHWHSEQMWKESTDKPLESQLSSILISMETRAFEAKEKRLESEEQNRRLEEKRKKEQEIKQLRKEEHTRAEELFKIASRWRKAKNVREFIKEVEDLAVQTNSMTSEKRDWIAWANKKANWMDPIVNLEDEILGVFNKTLD